VKDFSGRVVVITGAGSGIGAALAGGFAAEGASVVVADIDGEAAAATAASIGGSALSYTVDVTDADAVEGFADDVFRRLSRVDVLINNAGVFQGGLMWERSAADFDWSFDVNVFGITHAVRSFVPRMLASKREGHIVNTSSVAAFVTGAGSSPYVASKHAAFALTECLAHDLRVVGADIGVSVLTPSAFDTGIARTARVRPTAYDTDATGDGAASAQGLAAKTAEGLSPEAIVPYVLDGIREQRFLITTRPSARDQIQNRFSALLEGNLPGPVVVD
jgi:NAD(P)-dependent dehydrogenase (short-subunit alcohol dehydrogenase family)